LSYNANGRSSGNLGRFDLVPRFIDLLAVEGPDQGMRFTVQDGTYRVVARAPDEGSSTTSQLTPEGDRALDREQEAYVEAHRTRIKRRGPDIALLDGSVSRTHCLVFVDQGRASLADLMSTNGTKVNGALVRDVDLKPGDVIHVGKTKLRVEEG
jgi:hypothetical protein